MPNHNTSLPTKARITQCPTKNRPCVATRTVNFSHESKSPPTPLFEGGRGGFAFYHDMGNKKSTSALAERDALAAENEKLKALLASKQS
jgi:hypothetical protein